MMEEQEIPPNTDMRIESARVEGGGLQSLTITAHTEQAQIDLEMEYPRILKLLSRDWLNEES
jgi:hypothetical protein